jgi:hypothetical protein
MGVEINQFSECIWHEIYPGVFQRSMTPLECFFTPDLGWSVWSSIKLSSVPNTCESNEVLINQLRRAWIRVLYEQPQLASTFDFHERTCTYVTATEESLTTCLEETFVIEENSQNSIATRNRPILCFEESTQRLSFRAPHCYIDGIGVILLLGDIVKFLSNPQRTTFGDEVKNLPPVFDIAACLPKPQAADLERGAQLTRKFLQNQPSIGLPFQDRPSAPHSVSEICLSIEDSNNIVSACKARGLTVTHAVHAALIQATAELDPEAAAKYYTSIHIYNWRSDVQPKYQRQSTLHCSGFPMVVENPSTRNFEDLSAEMKKLYVGTNQDKDIAKAHSPWWSRLVTALNAAGNPPAASTPMLSSLGVIEKLLPEEVDGVKIEDFKFGIDIKGPVVTVYLWNWGGRINFSAAWDRGSFHEGEIDDFLSRIVGKFATPLSVTISLK